MAIDVVVTALDGSPEAIAGRIFTITAKADVTTGDNEAAFQVVTVAPAGADSDAGKIRLVVPSTDTAVDPGTYALDIEMRDTATPANVETIYFQDDFEVLSDVTRGA